MSVEPKAPAALHRETVEAAIVAAKGERLHEALVEPVYQALAALGDDPATLADYATLAAELCAAGGKVLRRSDLDKAVGKYRTRDDSPAADRTPDELRDGVEPWPDEVDGAALLDEIVVLLERHCVLPAGGAHAVALWVLAAYCIDSFRVFPKLLLHSPQKRCGKTTLLELLTALVPKPLTGSNVTPSVIFRAIEAWRVSVLLDEVDTFLHGHDELRGIVNSGHTRSTAYVWRVEGDTVREPVRYSTWAPMALGMIGSPPGTVLDRSIPIPLERKTAADTVTRLPRALVEDCLPRRRQCMRWATDNADRIADRVPSLADLGNDRAADNWTALAAVADEVGGAWPARARTAYRATTGAITDESDDLSIELLTDLRAILDDEPKRGTWPSSVFVDRLNNLAERPWPTLTNGRELTQHRLARLLKPYRIAPGTTRQGGGTLKGYKAERLREAFVRYLPAGVPPSETGTPAQARSDAGSSGFRTGTAEGVVPVPDRPRARRGAGCAGVPVPEGEAANAGASDAPSRAVL